MPTRDPIDLNEGVRIFRDPEPGLSRASIEAEYQELLEEYATLVATAADTPCPYLDERIADLREVIEATQLLHFT